MLSMVKLSTLNSSYQIILGPLIIKRITLKLRMTKKLLLVHLLDFTTSATLVT